jgi:hypothetical protein
VGRQRVAIDRACARSSIAIVYREVYWYYSLGVEAEVEVEVWKSSIIGHARFSFTFFTFYVLYLIRCVVCCILYSC